MRENSLYDKADLEIDRANLDVIMEKHSILSMGYLERLAEKESQLSDIKLDLEILEASIDKRIRGGCKKKPTEGEIKNLVISSESRVMAVKNFNKVLNEVKLLKAFCSRMDDKKKILEKLVDLYISGYYSKPKQRTKEIVIRDKNREALKNFKDKEGGNFDWNK